MIKEMKLRLTIEDKDLNHHERRPKDRFSLQCRVRQRNPKSKCALTDTSEICRPSCNEQFDEDDGKAEISRPIMQRLSAMNEFGAKRISRSSASFVGRETKGPTFARPNHGHAC